MCFVGLALNDRGEIAQGLIDGFGVLEDLGHVWLEYNNDVAVFRKTIYVLAANSAAEIIFVQHLGLAVIIRFLIHIGSFILHRWRSTKPKRSTLAGFRRFDFSVAW